MAKIPMTPARLDTEDLEYARLLAHIKDHMTPDGALAWFERESERLEELNRMTFDRYPASEMNSDYFNTRRLCRKMLRRMRENARIRAMAHVSN